MANISEALFDWSNTGSSNQPDSSDSSTLQADLQAIQAAVRGWLAHKGSDIASGATTDLGAVEGLMHDITGTTTVTAFGTVSAGMWKVIKFEGALTLTHNATSLILPGGANITTADGDIAVLLSEGSGNWRVWSYFRAATGAYLNINGATEDTAPASNADYVYTYDASASSHKKVLLGRLNATHGTEQATTSGTSIDFTSIPSWVKKITLQFVGVSTNGASDLQIQIGDSGGVETSGYSGASANMADSAATAASNYTAGFGVKTGAAAVVIHGSVVLTLEDSSDNTWTAFGVVGASNGAACSVTGGSKSLSATLDRVRLTTVNGTDTFDAGAVNILYE